MCNMKHLFLYTELLLKELPMVLFYHYYGNFLIQNSGSFHLFSYSPDMYMDVVNKQFTWVYKSEILEIHSGILVNNLMCKEQ